MMAVVSQTSDQMSTSKKKGQVDNAKSNESSQQTSVSTPKSHEDFLDVARINQHVETFKQLSSRPENFFLGDSEAAGQFKDMAKKFYELSKSYVDAQKDTRLKNSQSLPQLYLKNFDHVGIWEQLRLDCGPTLRKLAIKLSEASAKNVVQKRLKEYRRALQKQKQVELKNSLQEAEKRLKSAMKDRTQDDMRPKIKEDDAHTGENRNYEKTSIVDDKFFKLAEMEEFLETEERKLEEEFKEKRDEEKSDEEGSDDELENSMWFAEDDDEEGEEAHYEDFFGAKETDATEVDQPEDNSGEEASESDDEDSGDSDLDVRDAELSETDEAQERLNATLLDPVSSSDEESEGEGESVQQVLGKGADKRGSEQSGPPSKFEAEQKKLNETIQRLEQQNVSLDKPWHLKGEVLGEHRPENSLLEQVVQYDTGTRPAPIITEETTRSIEEIIKQRIKDEAWDDVERKTKPELQPFEYRKRLILNDEKSKVSLAEIYEKEYLNQQKEKEEDDPERNPKHEEIKRMLRSLFLQLDALSDFNFTPRPPEPQIKVINNLPAVAIEEAIPEAVNDAQLLAPTEVYEKPKGELKADTEKDSTDKKRQRRIKKKKMHLRRLKLEQQEKLPKSKGSSIAQNKYVRLEAKKKLKEAKAGKLADNESELARKALKSSSAFFAKLQEQVENQVHQSKKSDKRTSSANKISAKKLKL